MQGKGKANRIFYLSIPPSIFTDVAAAASDACSTQSGWNRFIVEKPFGRDLESFQVWPWQHWSGCDSFVMQPFCRRPDSFQLYYDVEHTSSSSSSSSSSSAWRICWPGSSVLQMQHNVMSQAAHLLAEASPCCRSSAPP